MVDLIVIGAGYWGVGTFLRAREAGWSALIIDDKDSRSGSRNASAICDPAAYKSSIFSKLWPADWAPSVLADSLSWLLDNGGEWTRETFWNAFEGRLPRVGNRAIYLPNPWTLLNRANKNRIGGKVVGINHINENWEVGVERDGHPELVTWYPTRNVVVAAGYRTDELLSLAGLSTLGVRGVYGRGLVVRGSLDRLLPLTVMIRPYCKHTVRTWNGGLKVGDTFEPTTPETDDDPKGMTTLRGVADAAFGAGGYEEVKVNAGFRPVLDRHTVEKVTEGFAVATGGHRVALGLTGWVGRRVLEILR